MNRSETSFDRRSILDIVRMLSLLVTFCFFILHAAHLSADFPNHSPWMDWSKYTDEGWYGDAAIRHYQRGHWYVYGDFNPAAALPVWPLLEIAVFRFTGVSVTAARGLTVGIFGLILVCSWLLLRRWQAAPRSLAPSAAILLLAVSPFCYAFTRLAILEPLLILLMLLALLAASALPQQGSRLRRYLPALCLGILIPLMVLTKTTAVFLFPAIAWLLWAACGYRLRAFARTALPATTLAAAIWISYFALLVRPHFLEDYRYLFSANGYTGITLATAGTVLQHALADGFWLGRVLYPVALLAILAVVGLLLRRAKLQPLLPTLLLWIAGYAAFLVYHDNLQPRYYLVLAIPLTLLVPQAFAELLGRLPAAACMPRLWASSAAALVLAAIAIPDALQTLRYVRTPRYTFVEAASQIRQIITANPSQSHLVLSVSGSQLSLMTGLPSICDDFGTLDLTKRAELYQPGWYIAWNQVEDDKMEALEPLYRLRRVAAFPAMDDPERNLLILYRLDPAEEEPPAPRKRKPIPRGLQTRMGQQPSVQQLEH